jgi:hypothetical protein
VSENEHRAQRTRELRERMMFQFLDLTPAGQTAGGVQCQSIPHNLLHSLTTLAISASAALAAQVNDAPTVNYEVTRPIIGLIIIEDLATAFLPFTTVKSENC